MKNVILPTVLIAAIFIYAAYRSTALNHQHQNPLPASGLLAGTTPTSESVLRTADFFITYSSTATQSALWLGAPITTIRSLFLPPPTQPIRFESLAKYDDPGRVAWSNTGNANADLLLELAPKSNHRLAVLRVNCSTATCWVEARERGILSGLTVWIADDGTSILAADTSLSFYPTIRDLMNNANESIVPRLTPRAPDELISPSRAATLILSDPEHLSGEKFEGPKHDRIHLDLGSPGTAVAVMMNNNVRMLVDDPTATKFWDCSEDLISNGTSHCTVYTAPPELPRERPVNMSDTECGIVVTRGNRTWLLRRVAKTQDVIEAEGIVDCRGTDITAYEKNQIRYVTPKRLPVQSEEKPATLTVVR